MDAYKRDLSYLFLPSHTDDFYHAYNQVWYILSAFLLPYAQALESRCPHNRTRSLPFFAHGAM